MAEAYIHFYQYVTKTCPSPGLFYLSIKLFIFIQPCIERSQSGWQTNWNNEESKTIENDWKQFEATYNNLKTCTAGQTSTA